MKDNDIIRRSDVLQLPVYSYPEIKALPAVDAVEVVRCKDCVYWSKTKGWCVMGGFYAETDGWMQ